jgi:hypothetical protein
MSNRTCSLYATDQPSNRVEPWIRLCSRRTITGRMLILMLTRGDPNTVQIAYIRVWDARFRTAGREAKGRAYQVGARRWRRAAALPIVAAREKWREGETER